MVETYRQKTPRDFIEILKDEMQKDRAGIFRQAIISLTDHDLAHFILLGFAQNFIDRDRTADLFFSTLQKCYKDGLLSEPKLTGLCSILTSEPEYTNFIANIVKMMRPEAEANTIADIMKVEEDTRAELLNTLIMPTYGQDAESIGYALASIYERREEIAVREGFDLRHRGTVKTPASIGILDAFLSMEARDLGTLDKFANREGSSVAHVAYNLKTYDQLDIVLEYLKPDSSLEKKKAVRELLYDLSR